MATVNAKGVEGIVSAVKFLSSMIVAVKKSLADDGKITFGDIPNLIGPLLGITSFISALGQIPAEFVDNITDEELATIVSALKEAGLDQTAITEGVELVVKIKNYVFNNFITKAEAPSTPITNA